MGQRGSTLSCRFCVHLLQPWNDTIRYGMRCSIEIVHDQSVKAPELHMQYACTVGSLTAAQYGQPLGIWICS